jgi:membrane-anchored glycerophosphoryl diester phosphodiesterase (GDPDase)
VPFVLASLWIQCRWIYAPLAVADGMGVREAMRASWRITRTGRALVWTRIAGAMLGWAIAGIAMMVLPLAWIGLPRVAAYFASGYALGLSAAQSGHAGSAHGSQ